MTAEIANKGHKVTIYTLKPDQWQYHFDIYDSEEKNVFSGNLSQITDSLQDAMKDADYI